MNIGIVGAGIVGLAVAREVARTRGATVTVLDKEDRFLRVTMRLHVWQVHTRGPHRTGNNRETVVPCPTVLNTCRSPPNSRIVSFA